MIPAFAFENFEFRPLLSDVEWPFYFRLLKNDDREALQSLKNAQYICDSSSTDMLTYSNVFDSLWISLLVW